DRGAVGVVDCHGGHCAGGQCSAQMMEDYLPHLLFALVWAVFWLVLLPMPELWRRAKLLAPRLMTHLRLTGLWQRGRTRMGVLHAYLPTMAILAIGIAVTLMIGEDFVELAVLLRQQSPIMLDVDQSVYRWAASMRSEPATLFFVAFTHIGGPIGLMVLAIGVAWLLFERGHRGLALYVIITGGGGALMNLLLKGLFERARPDLAEALRQAHGYSFPSGHAMGSMIVLGSLAYVMARSWGPWRLRSATIALLVTSIVTVGLSRVYLGVHWISDIGAGFAAGFVWLAVATVTFEAFWRIREIRGGEKEP
ncbi:MAG TPA: phosphatase PAP2 family protein, partial [Thermoanaerobaculia bacterium]|nr:phosphatase PAP2 family protein [Thermoanaerobaculia bacterium]